MRAVKVSGSVKTACIVHDASLKKDDRCFFIRSLSVHLSDDLPRQAMICPRQTSVCPRQTSVCPHQTSVCSRQTHTAPILERSRTSCFATEGCARCNLREPGSSAIGRRRVAAMHRKFQPKGRFAASRRFIADLQKAPSRALTCLARRKYLDPKGSIIF